VSEFQFPGSAPNVPIVGQPFAVKNGFVTIVGECKCGGEETIVMIVGARGVCPSCHKIWGIQRALLDGQTGRFECNIGQVGTAEPQKQPGGLIV
jgi:hypothetical protein